MSTGQSLQKEQFRPFFHRIRYIDPTVVAIDHNLNWKHPEPRFRFPWSFPFGSCSRKQTLAVAQDTVTKGSSCHFPHRSELNAGFRPYLQLTPQLG